jgi:hypothetical protein
MQQDNRNVPDWLLERLALGELDAETAADVRRRLAAEGRSPDEVVATVAASNKEILEQLPATPTAAAIRRRAEKAAERPVRRRAFLWTLPIALAGGVAASLLMTGPTERIKGEDLKVYVYRHGATGDELLTNGAHAAGGDLLQLAYASRNGGYGVLLSIDGARKVTLHLPENENGKAAPLREGGARVELPSAYQLDDAPAFERFFLVRAAAPFPITIAVDAARAVAAQPSARTQALALPPGFEQISLALDKTHAGKKESP